MKRWTAQVFIVFGIVLLVTGCRNSTYLISADLALRAAEDVVPMAVVVSYSTMLSAEMAIVVIGGMVSSTFLTLFVIPAIYSLAQRRQNDLP